MGICAAAIGCCLRSILNVLNLVLAAGVVATPQQAQEVHAYLRKYMATNVSAVQAETTRIIYGGSVNDGNCAEIGREEDIDGFLVGGASLKADAFVTICNARK